MPRNGLGQFVPLDSPVYPAQAGDTILSDYFNQIIDDLIGGLSNSISSDGQTQPSSNLPMNGKRHTGVVDAVSVDNYASYGQLLNVRYYVNPRDFGAVMDGTADDTAALVAANAAAVSANKSLAFTGIARVTSQITLTAPIVDTLQQIFTNTSPVAVRSGQVIRPEWWGAAKLAGAQVNTAVQTCLSQAQNVTVEVSRFYALSAPIAVDFLGVHSLAIRGAGVTNKSIQDGSIQQNRLGFNFSAAPAGTVCLTLTGIRGLDVENIYIEHDVIGSSASEALRVVNCRNVYMRGVVSFVQAGAGSIGIRLGSGSPSTGCFNVQVDSCAIRMNGGFAIRVDGGSEHVTLTNCSTYASYILTNGVNFISINNCSISFSPDYGIVIQASSHVSIDSSRGISAALGFLALSLGSIRVDIQNCSALSCNTLASPSTPDAILIDDSSDIYIDNFSSISPTAGTVRNVIASGASAGYTEINTHSAQDLALGFNGPPDWLSKNLSILGNSQLLPFSVTLSGWTFSTPPVITANFRRLGSSVTISIHVVPTSATTTSAGTSKIQLPFSSLDSRNAAVLVTDSILGVAQVGCVNSAGSLFMPNVPAATIPFTITGTLLNF